MRVPLPNYFPHHLLMPSPLGVKISTYECKHSEHRSNHKYLLRKKWMYHFSTYAMFSRHDLACSILFAWDTILCFPHLHGDFVSFKFQFIHQTLSKDLLILKVLPTPHMSFHGICYVLLCNNNKYFYYFINIIILITISVLVITGCLSVFSIGPWVPWVQQSCFLSHYSSTVEHSVWFIT